MLIKIASLRKEKSLKETVVGARKPVKNISMSLRKFCVSETMDETELFR